jgi:hypothetical protein
MLTLVASSVAACSASTPSAKVPVDLPPLPVEFTCTPDKTDCKPPCPYAVLIPDRDIDQAETERLWRVDRTGLVTCRKNSAAVVTFYDNLRTNLGAARAGGAKP